MQVKFLARFVVLVDGAAVHAGQLIGAGYDRAQNGSQIQRRADRLPNLTERLEFAHGPRQLGGPRLQLLEQPHVLDGDHCLIGEGPEQRDLLVRERSRLGAAGGDCADRAAVAHEGNGQGAPEARGERDGFDREIRVLEHVRNRDNA